VKGLLERGADPKAVDKKNVSALHFACGQGRQGVVQFLWSRGVELDSEDPGHSFPTRSSNLLGGLRPQCFLPVGKKQGTGCRGTGEIDTDTFAKHRLPST
jgi:hypothetical protein